MFANALAFEHKPCSQRVLLTQLNDVNKCWNLAYFKPTSRVEFAYIKLLLVYILLKYDVATGSVSSSSRRLCSVSLSCSYEVRQSRLAEFPMSPFVRSTCCVVS